MPLILVLSVGADASVLQTRDLVLRSAGYLVESVRTVSEGAKCFLGGDFDLVIMCHSIPSKERDYLISLIRASGSRTPVVSLWKDSHQYDGFANATFEDDPQKWLVEIREVLAKAARPAAWEVTRSKKRKEISVSAK